MNRFQPLHTLAAHGAAVVCAWAAVGGMAVGIGIGLHPSRGNAKRSTRPQ